MKVSPTASATLPFRNESTEPTGRPRQTGCSSHAANTTAVAVPIISRFCGPVTSDQLGGSEARGGGDTGRVLTSPGLPLP